MKDLRSQAVLGAALLASSLAAQTSVYLYEETFGSSSWIGRYEVTPSGFRMELAYSGGGESHDVSLDASSLSGLEWRWQGALGSVRAERRGGIIKVEGRVRGRERRAQKDIGDLPWYQAPDFSLAALALRAEGTRQDFWMIQPEELAFFKMSARNAGRDAFALGGREIPAIRVVLSVAGLSELVWKNEYWYSPEGEYLGFKGRRGGPLAPYGRLVLISKTVEP